MSDGRKSGLAWYWVLMLVVGFLVLVIPALVAMGKKIKAKIDAKKAQQQAAA
jgi:hypothetical protein